MVRRVKSIIRVPFRKRRFYIEEGWFYSREESAIHKLTKHRAIDFRLKPGTPIVAAADGVAVGSYQHSLRYYRNKVLKYKGKPLGYGYGYFVIIYHPTSRRFTLYGHLSRLSSCIPFIKPQGTWPSLKSQLLSMPARRLLAIGKRVHAGTVIGWSGDSGCTWGYCDYPARPTHAKAWDGPHLHFELFTRDKSGQRRFVDPFGIYGQFQVYPRPSPAGFLSI